MAERKKSKESKGNEGEEGTDGSKQKGGGGEKDHQQKRSRIGGAAHFVHKRVTGQPRVTPKKKEGKSDLSSFDTPAPPPSLAQESSQQQLGSIWDPAPWQQDTKQQAPVAVVSSVPSGETLPSTEGATPPTAMKYDDDDDDDDLTSFVPEAVVPQQPSDDPELSLRLVRIELENERHKRELKDKERQIKEYEEDIILLRTQMSRSGGGGGGGIQVVVDQSTTQKLTCTIQQLEREKEELEQERDKLAKKLEERELMGKVEITEAHKEKERDLAEAMEAVKREKKKKEELQKELNDMEANKIEQLQLQKATVDDLRIKLARKEEDILLAQAETATERKEKEAWQEQLLKEKEEERKEKERLQKQLQELKAEHELKLREQKERHKFRNKELKSEVERLTKAETLRQSDIGSTKREAELERELGIEKDHVTSLQERIATLKEGLQEERIKTKDKDKLHKQELERERTQVKEQLYEAKQIKDELIALKQRNNELEKGETNKVKEMEDEIQVLTAQVNAYRREVERQKRLVTQSQEKHKTEVNELNRKLANEMKSSQNLVNELEKKLANTKQQLVDELTIIKEQLHRTASATKDSLLKSDQQLDNKLDEMKEQFSVYSCQKQEIEKLKDEIKVFQISKQELENQLSLKQEEVASFRRMLSGFQSCWEVSHGNVSSSEKDLGRGAWGVVLMGQLRVAVKQLHQAIENPYYLEILYREIDIMSQLRHPNLLQFIGAVLDHPSGYPLIITEVMDTSLRKAYENKKLTPDPGCRPVILSIMHDVAVGLNYLHCLPDPIIHRDVSSANVLLQSIAGPNKWKAKVSDFGSANLAHKSNTRAPGAAAYSAPEVLQSIKSYDSKKQTTKMDVFSYGVLLCEIIVCRFPDMDFFRDMLSQVKSISTRPRCNRYTQGILLHSLIDLCMNDDPVKRPTMNQIIEKLDAI